MAVIAVAARLFQARIPALAWVRTISLVVAAFLVSGAGFVGGTMSHGSMGGHSHDGGDAHDMPTTPHHGETPVPADPGQPPTATGSDVPTSGSAAPPMTGSGAPTSGSAAGATPALPAKKPHLDDGHAH